MQKTYVSLFIAAAIGVTAIGVLANADEDSHEPHEREHDRGRGHHGDRKREQHGGKTGSTYLSDPQFALYKTECGGCHMAYPASMLPSASWQGMMASLEEHFGDNAELDSDTADQIASFLFRNAAGKGRGEYSERSWRATRDRNPPLRITLTDYFRGQHHEIPAKMVAGNPEVGSFSRCETCHRGAEQGDFDEHGVRIPGYGRWDD